MKTTSRFAIPVLSLLGIFPASSSHPAEPAAALAAGAVYYVSPTGDDANPGTLTQPWRTIEKAVNTLTAGETVYIRAGTYRERILPQNSGSAGQYIVYASYPGETVTVDGSGISVPEDEGLFYVARRSHIRISGLRIVNSGYAGIHVDNSSYITIEKNYTYNTASSGIGVWGSNHVIVDGNEVELACSNGTQESLTVAGTDTFEIRNNEVHNGVAGYDKEGIDAKDGSSNGKVYGNLVHHTKRVGIYVEAWDKLTSNIEVYRNVVHDSDATGFSLASESGGRLEHIRLYNNIAYHNRTVGIFLSACCPQATTHPMNDIKIINNTLFDNGNEPWGGGIGVENRDVQNIVIRNNLVSQNLTFQIAIDSRIATQNVTVDHNLIDGYRGGEGEVYGEAWVGGNPLFVSSTSANFRLQPGSPAIDAGTSLEAPADDFDGTIRPQDGNRDGTAGFDPGAFELGSVSASLDPSIDITLSKATYATDETITINSMRVRNPASSPTRVRVRIWLKVPTFGEVALADIGSDNSFSMPGSVDAAVGPIPLITLTSTFPPRGNWELNSRVSNPTSGAVLTEDINPFIVQ